VGSARRKIATWLISLGVVVSPDRERSIESLILDIPGFLNGDVW